VVLSDDSGASAKIEEYAGASSRWLVAVRMVSEGVDVPRLCVGVYATSTSTPLFFAQAVGRFVRARKRGETASVFLPSVPVILEHAASMEVERDHALDRPSSAEDEASLWAEEEGLLAAANRTERTMGIDEPTFEALESDAHFDHVLFDAQQFGLHAAVGSEEEQDYLGLPGLLEPDQVATLLHERQTKQSRQTTARTWHTPAPVSAHRALAAQRKELNALVAAYAKKTGSPHANIHMELRRACGGPELAQASSDQVGERIERIRRWFVTRR
ncbi:MAG TPA: ATP-dependent helicase, partial [Phycicoccus sp.]|nr:ATP-dependent helicase [Phycicoccus sp.]